MNKLLLRCLSEEEARLAMREVHEGLCGTHQSAHKMRWTLRRAGVYWPTMLNACFKYYKGCEESQKFIGEIHPSSRKGPCFVLVATDYFSKWVDSVPLKNMTHREVIDFVLQNIIY
jgi:hypothetical protein